MNKLLQAADLICNTEMSNRKIGAIVGIAYNTVRRYRRLIEKKQLSWANIEAMTGDALERFLGTAARRLSFKVAPDMTHVHRELQRRDVTRALLWEEYRLANPGNALSMSQFNEHYRQYAGKLDLTMRQSHRAGECAFVDFAGSTISWTDPETGKVHWAQVFVGVLGCSNYTFVLALPSQGSEDWCRAHEEMCRFFGGVPQVLVPDNLKAAVIRPGREPELNRVYHDLARHYRFVIVPARIRKPRDKAKAEVGVQFAQRWIIAALRNRKFFSLAEINVAIAELLPRLNERPFKRLPGSRRSRFLELDQPMLRPLPPQPFEYGEWTGSQKVGLDYHIYVYKHYYSVPCALVRESVDARVSQQAVEIFHKGKRVATHVRSHVVGGHTTLPEHQPPEHRQYAEQTEARFVAWAQTIGAAAVAAVRHQFVSRPYGLLAQQACSTLQSLAKTHGEQRFEAACRRAEAIGSLTVKSIRSILQRKLKDPAPLETAQVLSLPHHANIRGASYFSRSAGGA